MVEVGEFHPVTVKQTIEDFICEAVAAEAEIGPRLSMEASEVQP